MHTTRAVRTWRRREARLLHRLVRPRQTQRSLRWHPVKSTRGKHDRDVAFGKSFLRSATTTHRHCSRVARSAVVLARARGVTR